MDELAKFSTLLKQINEFSPKNPMDLQAVFKEVFQLYGNERKHLLAGEFFQNPILCQIDETSL